MLSDNYLEARNQRQQSQGLLDQYKQSSQAADANFSERQNEYKAAQDFYQNQQNTYSSTQEKLQGYKKKIRR